MFGVREGDRRIDKDGDILTYEEFKLKHGKDAWLTECPYAKIVQPGVGECFECGHAVCGREEFLRHFLEVHNKQAVNAVNDCQEDNYDDETVKLEAELVKVALENNKEKFFKNEKEDCRKESYRCKNAKSIIQRL